MYTMYANIVQIIPLIILMLGHTRYEESPPPPPQEMVQNFTNFKCKKKQT